jgi:LAO/AO transport system kinase
MQRAIISSFRGNHGRKAAAFSSRKINDDSLVENLAKGILQSKRDCLARAITLIESTRSDHGIQAEKLLDYLTLHAAGSFDGNGAALSREATTLRLGVAGPPGAGKSTFIEKLGMTYVNNGRKVAVIPVDPSSHISGGSILGDKTRMEQLSRSDRAYIRASPTRGKLGGIAEHTSDVIHLCEAGIVTIYSFSVRRLALLNC